MHASFTGDASKRLIPLRSVGGGERMRRRLPSAQNRYSAGAANVSVTFSLCDTFHNLHCVITGCIKRKEVVLKL